MSEEIVDSWKGLVVFAACLLIPLFGCGMAVYTLNSEWLVLLAPLIVFMEGAFLLGPLAFFVVMCLIDWRTPAPTVDQKFGCTQEQQRQANTEECP